MHLYHIPIFQLLFTFQHCTMLSEVSQKEVIILVERFDIAGYCRISVDEELDRDNTSIENQKAIIEDFVRQ